MMVLIKVINEDYELPLDNEISGDPYAYIQNQLEKFMVNEDTSDESYVESIGFFKKKRIERTREDYYKIPSMNNADLNIDAEYMNENFTKMAVQFSYLDIDDPDDVKFVKDVIYDAGLRIK